MPSVAPLGDVTIAPDAVEAVEKAGALVVMPAVAQIESAAAIDT